MMDTNNQFGYNEFSYTLWGSLMYSQPYVVDRYYTEYMGVKQIFVIWDSS